MPIRDDSPAARSFTIRAASDPALVCFHFATNAFQRGSAFTRAGLRAARSLSLASAFPAPGRLPAATVSRNAHGHVAVGQTLLVPAGAGISFAIQTFLMSQFSPIDQTADIVM